MKIHSTVTCPIHDSFRVQQVAGMFDVPLAQRATESFEAELPEHEEPWRIGMIVGPSGSGKSSIARRAYGDALADESPWPPDRAVVDCFGELPTRRVVELMTAVGFGSPPSWIKPYAALSGGERFRCDLARALAGAIEARGDVPLDASAYVAPQSLPLVVFDEFTSVVDRTVAKVGSAAVGRAVRTLRVPCRFVAVTCHYDVANWLEPDWVLDMATRRLERRRLRRPSLEIEVGRCGLEAWPSFARHHYLTGLLAPQARCYLATWRSEPVAFAATLPVFGRPGRRRFTRIVTLPDYQGIGIGSRVVEAVAALHREEGLRINLTTSHPGLVGHCKRSSAWRNVGLKKTGQKSSARDIARGYRSSAGRAVASFEFLGAGELGARSEELGARR